VKEIFPPKVVDKIDVNKILKEIGLILEFDYRGEIDFSKTKAYTLEEGLDQELKVFVNDKQLETKLKSFLKMLKLCLLGKKFLMLKNLKMELF